MQQTHTGYPESYHQQKNLCI